MRKVLATLIATLGLFGCKTTEPSSESKDLTGAPPKILLVGAGGWKSCGTSMNPFDQRIFDSFKTLAQDLSAHAEVDYLAACLHNVTPAKNVANLWYAGKDGQVYKVKARDFPYYVQQHIDQTRPTQVYFVGHSYGGWVALRLAEAGVKANAVFALDPIDARACLPVDNFFLGLGVESADCKRVPDMDYGAIEGATKRIYQLWQPLGPIHSTVMDSGIAVNHQLDINHSSFGGLQTEKVTYAHRMIGSEPTAWGIVCHAIFTANSWSPNECRTIETDGDGKFKTFVNAVIPELGGADFVGPTPVQPDPIDDGGSHPEPFPIGNRITCTKTPQTPTGPINWRVSVVQSGNVWKIDARRNEQHLYDETSPNPVLFEQQTSGGLTNYVVDNQTLWLSLKPNQDGTFIGRFFTQKHNYDIQQMNCARE